MIANVYLTSYEFVKLKLAQILDDVDFRKALQEMIQCIISAELCKALEALPYERTKNRKNYRNGFRPRKIITSLGVIVLKIPKLRKGSFYPSILERYQRITDSMICVIQEAYIHGVSTRSMNRLYKDLLSEGLSKSTISRLCQSLHKQIFEWNNRRLKKKYLYVWLDGKYTKKYENKKRQKVHILHGIGVTYEGNFESLGFYLADNEDESNWRYYLNSLKKRGLESSLLWIRDEHKGLIAALNGEYSGQQQQRCIVHWIKNVLDSVKPKHKDNIAILLKGINESKSKDQWDFSFSILKDKLEKYDYEELLDTIEFAQYDLKSYLDFPDQHWRKIKSNNPIERLNEELKRRFKTIPIFPNNKSISLLTGSILLETSKSWRENGSYIELKHEN